MGSRYIPYYTDREGELGVHVNVCVYNRQCFDYPLGQNYTHFHFRASALYISSVLGAAHIKRFAEIVNGFSFSPIRALIMYREKRTIAMKIVQRGARRPRRKENTLSSFVPRITRDYRARQRKIPNFFRKYVIIRLFNKHVQHCMIYHLSEVQTYIFAIFAFLLWQYHTSRAFYLSLALRSLFCLR